MGKRFAQIISGLTVIFSLGIASLYAVDATIRGVSTDTDGTDTKKDAETAKVSRTRSSETKELPVRELKDNVERTITIEVDGEITRLENPNMDPSSPWGIDSGGEGYSSVIYKNVTTTEAKRYNPVFKGTALEDFVGAGQGGEWAERTVFMDRDGEIRCRQGRCDDAGGG